MSIIGVCGVCFIGSIMSLVVKKLNPSFSGLCSIVCCIVISVFVFDKIGDAFDFLYEISSDSSANEYIFVMIKGLCISYIAQIGCDICRDMGQPSVSSKVAFAAKVEIILLSLPLLKSALELTRELISV